MLTEENGMTINYIGEKTDDLYIAEVKCKEDDSDSNFIKLQKICVRLAKYKRYKEDIERELQSIKQRQIAGVFLLLWQLKQNKFDFAAVRQVLQFPYISYCLSLSKINPVEYNFANQIRDYRKKAALEGIYVTLKDMETEFFRNNPFINNIDLRRNDNDFEKILIYIFMAKSVKLIDFGALFFCNNEKYIDMVQLVAEFIASKQNDVNTLCNMLQEELIKADCSDMDIFKNIPDSLKYIFQQTNGKYLYLEQLLDLYAHVFNCSFQSSYKMTLQYNHRNKNEGKILWKEYEQQITNPEYFKVSEILQKMQHQNLRGSQTYTLFYAILLHMRLTKIRKLAKTKNIKI